MNMCHMEFTESTCCVDPLIPMSDQDRISPTTSTQNQADYWGE